MELDSPAGRAWSDRQIGNFCEAQSRGLPSFPPVEGTAFIMELIAATYANIQYPGVSVPFYM